MADWIFENRNGLIGCTDQEGQVFFSDDPEEVRDYLTARGVVEVSYARPGSQKWLDRYISAADAKAAFSGRHGGAAGKKSYVTIPVSWIGDGESIVDRIAVTA